MALRILVVALENISTSFTYMRWEIEAASLLFLRFFASAFYPNSDLDSNIDIQMISDYSDITQIHIRIQW